MEAAILGQIIEALKRIGKSTDAASAAGSLHAKVKEGRDTIYDYLQNTLAPKLDAFKSKQPCFACFIYTSVGTRTVLSVSGAGFLLGITVIQDTGLANLKITIDGTIQYDGITNNISLAKGFANYSTGHGALNMLHRFNSSFVVELQNTATNACVHIAYVLD